MASNYFPERLFPEAISPNPMSPSGSAPSTPGGLSNRSNALTSRISSVLSASYADLDIRDALQTIDERGIKNTQETRRQLRLEIQKEVIQCNGQIVRDFGQVAQQLKRIGAAVANLNQCCADMRAHISSSNQETGPVLEEAVSLIGQKEQTETKQRLLDAFTSHFMISENDTTVLTSTAEPVNDEFFRVLQSVKKIHKDSQILLGTENQRLGLEILEQSSKNLNAAYQKLYRWVQREFKTLDLENPQISTSIRRSLRVLAERPALFQSCLDFFAEAREDTLSDAFYAALTGSSADIESAPDAKPIELHAHEPLRYVGDMLAWVHSATVSEREALEVLFISDGDEIAKGIQAGLDSEPWSRGGNELAVFDGRKALNELVGRDITGAARALRQRTEQVIQSHDDATLAYRIANLIGFYKVTFSKLLSEDGAIFDVLSGLEESALDQFRVNMQDHVVAIQADLAIAPTDLSPPDFLDEGLTMLRTLIKSYDSSITAMESRDAAFLPVLAEALDPFLQGCETMANRIEEPGSDVFLLNCIFAAKATLSPFSFTATRVSELEEEVDDHAARLIEYQHRFLLHTSGLYPLIMALSPPTDSTAEDPDTETDISSFEPLSTLAPFKPDALMVTSQMLDDFLPSALMDAMENVKQLRNSKMAHEVTEEAAERFCEDFEFVEGKILAADEMREANGEGDVGLRELFPRTGAEIRVLLS
ncbi:oligomeric complex COG6 [Aulographum hederae CBS 113979]|uniref:Conserved oligomeric Golgi complex subunit 6 n=1 Tax=Aulographum hederae CBS 113979 TaxID=1176131 RepID=A0A6G1GY76_9PEZI|nr:oligomeric complex COG6 [Aulographum hederae CBS 113979]